MIVIGITGGIASGKSTASHIFQHDHNAYVFDADKEAKHLLLKKEISDKTNRTSKKEIKAIMNLLMNQINNNWFNI